ACSAGRRGWTSKHGGKAAALCLFLNGTFLNGTFVPCGDGAMGGDGWQLYHRVVFPDGASRGDNPQKGRQHRATGECAQLAWGYPAIEGRKQALSHALRVPPW